MDNSDVEIKFSTKTLPFEYKWLEFRSIINKELYDEKIINLKEFNAMQNIILTKMTRVKNEYKNKISN